MNDSVWIKRLIFLLILFCIPALCKAQDKRNSGIKKYLEPFQITKLDWIVLNLQINTFSDLRRYSWDEFGLITGIKVYHIERSAVIGATFTLDNETYIRLNREVISKIFKEAVQNAYDLIKLYIPEIRLDSDIYANFVSKRGLNPIIRAEFHKGKLNFSK
jgi:hypothetical protein